MLGTSVIVVMENLDTLIEMLNSYAISLLMGTVKQPSRIVPNLVRPYRIRSARRHVLLAVATDLFFGLGLATIRPTV
jgi:hypothetical protein